MTDATRGAGSSRLGAAGDAQFHVVSVGWGARVIGNLFDGVEERTGFRFSHIVLTAEDGEELSARPDRHGVHCIRANPRAKMPAPDASLLGSLERPDTPTIHNMIMGDRVVRGLRYEDAQAYATFLAVRIAELYESARPSTVIGGFDGLHGGIALAVARKLGIPWFALHFSIIPKGLSCFCNGMMPTTCVPIRSWPAGSLRALAEKTLSEFEDRRLAAPAYFSANSTAMVLKRLPAHLETATGTVARTLTGRWDPYVEYSAWQLCRQYLRKRLNLYSLPSHRLLERPPGTPYILFGLHRQPESSIDVWAPFYSDQLAVVESIARATPPTHRVLVKLHKSDADSYSRRELDRFRRVPGVTLVSPFAQSREFVDNAALVVSIQGTLGLEAALLGKPVLVFGDSRMTELPSVSRVRDLTDLPGQIRCNLSEEPPEREAVIRGFMTYLSAFSPGCYNDWDVDPSAAELDGLADQFKSLQAFVRANSLAAV